MSRQFAVAAAILITGLFVWRVISHGSTRSIVTSGVLTAIVWYSVWAGTLSIRAANAVRRQGSP
ncbi:MAG TPA: hypothetical protein VGM82_00730 [Gemmatimonadaceae bacterium]